MHPPILVIARFTLLEARRTRLPLMAMLALAAVWAAGLFVHQLAITDTSRIQSAFYAAGARLTAVFLLSLHIIGSMVREFNDKGLELLLSLDLPRASYLVGKFAGYTGVAAALALAAAIPLAVLAAPDAAALWAASLVLELAIVAAASLLCIVTFTQILPAATFVAGFYLLARAMDALRLMAQSSLLGTLEASRDWLSHAVEAVAFLLPALDRFTSTEWISGEPGDWGVLGGLFLQAVVYISLLLAAALFDFYRREL